MKYVLIIFLVLCIILAGYEYVFQSNDNYSFESAYTSFMETTSILVKNPSDSPEQSPGESGNFFQNLFNKTFDVLLGPIDEAIKIIIDKIKGE